MWSDEEMTEEYEADDDNVSYVIDWFLKILFLRIAFMHAPTLVLQA